MADLIQFTKNIETDERINIFKNFFEEHMLTYDLLNDIEFGAITTKIDSSSIIYSVKLLNESDKSTILNRIKSTCVSIRGKIYEPEVFLNGDLLCITFKK